MRKLVITNNIFLRKDRSSQLQLTTCVIMQNQHRMLGKYSIYAKKVEALGKAVKPWTAMKCIDQRSSIWNVIQLLISSDSPHAHSCEKPIQHLFHNDPGQTSAINMQRSKDGSHVNQPFH